MPPSPQRALIAMFMRVMVSRWRLPTPPITVSNSCSFRNRISGLDSDQISEQHRHVCEQPIGEAMPATQKRSILKRKKPQLPGAEASVLPPVFWRELHRKRMAAPSCRITSVQSRQFRSKSHTTSKIVIPWLLFELRIPLYYVSATRNVILCSSMLHPAISRAAHSFLRT
jgi:hypothetical protein